MKTPGSSAIRKIDYDYATRVLTIYLRENPGHNHGEVLKFSDVPKKTYEDFSSATSKGGFFNLFIRNQYNMV